MVIGVGNPTLSDDGVGLRAAQAVATRLAERADVDVRLLCAGGLRLMETMVGYDRAVVLDALTAGDAFPGTIVELTEGDLSSTRNLASVHDLSLPYALDLGRLMGMALPATIVVLGVRAADVTTFSEELSPPVAAAIGPLADRVFELLAPVAVGNRRR
ncbi:MAG: hydrogenase maturation protease [Dactylosporangium sp.]|nr:hydrogenase maturation protease [Dactylosporangium sp.]